MIADVKKTAEQKMQKSLEALKTDLGKIRTGRAHTGILDHITVDYYGTQMPLNQVANLTLIDARTIASRPGKKMERIERRFASPISAQSGVAGRSDSRADAGADRGAAARADQGGQGEGENAKVAVRNLRRDANHHLKDLLRRRPFPRTMSGARRTKSRNSPTIHRRDRQAARGQRDRPDGSLTRLHPDRDIDAFVPSSTRDIRE